MCHGPVKCGRHNFCVGFDNENAYCYGKSDDCMWDSDDCKKHSDCFQYSSSSPKYPYQDKKNTSCPLSVGPVQEASKCEPGIFYSIHVMRKQLL